MSKLPYRHYLLDSPICYIGAGQARKATKPGAAKITNHTSHGCSKIPISKSLVLFWTLRASISNTFLGLDNMATIEKNFISHSR